MSMIIPICENIFNVCPKIQSDKIAPAIANGTVNMIISGSIKLSNCAARIRKISPNARKNANELEVMEEKEKLEMHNLNIHEK